MSEKVGREIMKIIDKLLEKLPTAELAGTSWRDYGEAILIDNINEAYKIAHEFSSEHVQILTQNPREVLEKMSNYGALFLGEKTCVSYGDKCIGTNHVLLTRKLGNLHRWSLGGQVPQDADVPRDWGRKGERRDRQALWEVFKGREL
ncbi:hypothetical protein NW754_004800 [Fusarium falciforme]|nr:hypothetical protein NW754_004800 [Fusarium falciforme]